VGFIARLLKGRELASDRVLTSLGLAEGYQAAVGLPKVTWPHYKPGAQVVIVASPDKAAWRFSAKSGDTGVVEALIQGCSNGFEDSDLYKVKLDHPTTGADTVFLFFRELKVKS